MRLCATFPAVPRGVAAIRNAVVDFAEECGMTDRALDDVRLAVSEAASNAVIHAYQGRGGEIRVVATRGDAGLQVVIADDGHGPTPQRESATLGLGLPLMATVARRMEVVAGDGGTEVHLLFDCPPGGDAP